MSNDKKNQKIAAVALLITVVVILSLCTTLAFLAGTIYGD